jgi:hypothetical protein
MQFPLLKNTKSIYRWSLAGILSILILSVITISPATAETKQLALTLNSYDNQNFASLIQQAESLAQYYIEQEFRQNSSATEVSITIVGERNGQTVPLLSSKVSRFNWQNQPIIQNWTTYFRSSKTLLGFVQPPVPQSASTTSRSWSNNNPIYQENSRDFNSKFDDEFD